MNRKAEFFNTFQSDFQTLCIWDKIMCVGSDLMQNKGNKVQNEFFFFQSGLH